MKTHVSHFIGVGAAAVVLLGAPAAPAAVPQMTGYQAVLADPGGQPIRNDSLSVTFSIYDAATSGSLLWQEVQEVVTNNDGLFNTTLGAVAPIPDSVFADSARWLGITVETDPEMSPRLRFLSTPYSYRVGTVDGAMGGIISGDVAIQSNLDVNGEITATGMSGKIRFDYNDITDLPDPTVFEGMFAHVVNEGRAYYASDGQWVPLADSSHSHTGLVANGWIDDGAVVRLDVASDRVGIGIATPTEKLEVNGNVVVSGKATIGQGHTNTNTAGFVAGENNTASGEFASVSGGEENTAGGDWATVAGGFTGQATGLAAAVGGGEGNTASGGDAVVGGGNSNTASGNISTIAGGNTNTASGVFAFVGGGMINLAGDTASTVAGGRFNKARGVYSTIAGGGGPSPADSNRADDYAFVGGGTRNWAGGFATVGGGSDNAAYSEATVAGGRNNTAYSGSVGGGRDNAANGILATVGGGLWDSANGHWSVVAGGLGNVIGPDVTNAQVSTIGGGEDNRIGGGATGATISGGQSNRAGDEGATIAGGSSNQANGAFATIGGGAGNVADGDVATISGGNQNVASGYHSFVGGGEYNKARGYYSVVAGGGGANASDSNEAVGNWSVISGGRANRTLGDYSLAAGRRAKADHGGTFVWADSTDADFVSTAGNQFLIRAGGGVGIGTANPAEQLSVAGVVQSTTGGFRFPDGSVQTTAATGSGSGWSDAGSVVRLDTSTDSVGIGTATPTQPLDVAGNVHVAETLFTDYVSSNSPLELQTAGTPRMHIDDVSGNVGIGTVTPSQPLDVYGNVHVAETLFASQVSSNSPLQLQTAGTTRMHIDDVTGNVGIGTTNPTATLHLATGGIRYPDGTLQTSAGVGVASSVVSNTDVVVNADADANGTGDIMLQTHGDDVVRINNAGRVSIGTSSVPANVRERLVVAGPGLTEGGIELDAGTSTGGAAINGMGGGGVVIYTYTGAVGAELYTERMRIDANGYVGIGKSNPSGPLDVAGPIATATTTLGLGNNITLDEHFSVILAQGNSIITLPLAGGRFGRRYTIKHLGGFIYNTTIVTTGSETIDGSSSYVLNTPFGDPIMSYVTVVSGGFGWFIVAHH